MRVCGVHYDIGTVTIQGTLTRPVLTTSQLEHEIQDISEGLGANAIRITGGEIERMVSASEIAARHQLEVWISPMIPNADQATTLEYILESARLAESLRRSGANTVLVLGCELSVFMAGVLPGETHAERLALLSDPAQFLSEVMASGVDPQKEMGAFLQSTAEAVRSKFQGPLTYASGMWEEVDWSHFDFVGLDAYRDASNRQNYSEILREQVRHGRPVILTEIGCATYRGASDAGGLAWSVVERSNGSLRLPQGIERDETEQANEISDVLSIAETCGTEGAFVYTYIAPSYPSSLDRGQDLDAASYALVRSWPDGRTEKKSAYHAVAKAYAGSR